MAIKSLNEIIKFNNSFKTSINLYLSLNKAEKVLSYIPTKSFADGSNLQALIAIKCLDEGVNIPKIKTAFILASTNNPKAYMMQMYLFNHLQRKF